jgi:DNA-directed RNA polymerase specialized sigma24 family protein
MARLVLEIIHERHEEWVYMVRAFGCNEDTAEDIVQDMYLKMHKIISSGKNVMYNNEEVNTYYILKTLKSIFIDKTRKEKQNVSIDYETEAYHIQVEDTPDYEDTHDRIVNELEKLYWFDQKVFEIVSDGVKISELSRKTTIPYYTLYNTYKKVYNHLKEYL